MSQRSGPVDSTVDRDTFIGEFIKYARKSGASNHLGHADVLAGVNAIHHDVPSSFRQAAEYVGD